MTNDRIDAFIRAQVLDSKVTPSKGQPPQARCLRIERIALVSVARHLGLRRGDLVVSIDGKPAGSFDPKLYRDPVDRRPYTFWSPWREERIDATISGAPIGAELRKTVAAMWNALAKAERNG